MPRQNRVTPFGEVVAIPERGSVMGNRGRLHDPSGRIRRSWQGKRWILCELEFRGRQRVVMAPDRYTELFFLDEATGLSAGHRPCFECRRRSYHAFVDAWVRGNRRLVGDRRPSADQIDAQLHNDRVGPGGSKRVYSDVLDDLPDGVFLGLGEGRAGLLWEGQILGWTPGGYLERLPRPEGRRVEVLTPRSTVAAIRSGYRPQVHDSAGQAGSISGWPLSGGELLGIAAGPGP